jgi:hypothetical protein
MLAFMTAMDSVKAELDEAAYIIRRLTAQVTELIAENERLKAGLDAHSVLQSIYRNSASTEANRIRAAQAALNVEKPRLSMTAYAGKLPDRRTLWQTYQRWTLKNEIVLSTRKPPPPDYDAHLLADSYEPPPGDALPPRTIIDTASGFRIIVSDMMPGSSNRRNGNGGNGDDSDDTFS